MQPLAPFPVFSTLPVFTAFTLVLSIRSSDRMSSRVSNTCKMLSIVLACHIAYSIGPYPTQIKTYWLLVLLANHAVGQISVAMMAHAESLKNLKKKGLTSHLTDFLHKYYN